MRMTSQRKRWWRFYESSSGAPVFAEELRALGPDAAAAVTDTMKAVARGQALAREDEKVDDELRATRTTYDGCEYRVLYGVVGATGRILLGVYVLNKKTRRLPASALKTARTRLRDWEARGKSSEPT